MPARETVAGFLLTVACVEMVQTRFAIIYNTNTKIVRRIFFPDNDAELSQLNLLPQESAHIEVYPNAIGGHAGFATYLAQHFQTDKLYAIGRVVNVTGVTPPDDYCVVVDNTTNLVIHACHADVTWEVWPDHSATLMSAYSHTIGVGHSYNPATGLFSTPQVILPPGPKNPTTITIPPQVIPKP